MTKNNSPKSNQDERRRIAAMQPSPEDLPEAISEPVGSIRSGSLAGKTMWSAIWFLAIPILVQQILVACVGLADKIFAGALPDEVVLPAMDAIGIGSYIGWFIAIAVSGIGIGAQALISRAMGSGNTKLGHKVLGQSIVLAFFWGIVVGIALWWFAKPLGDLCNLSEGAKEYLIQYIRVLALGMPACSVMTTGSMALHGSGDTVRPAVVTVIVNIVNIFVSWSLSGANVRLGESTFINPFTWDLHVIGIAIGTAIAYLVGALLIVLVLLKGVKDLKLDVRDLAPDFSLFWRIAKIGIPNFFEGLSMWAANLFVLQFIGQIAARMAIEIDGDEPVVQGLQGAHVIGVQWESFSFLPGFAIGVAAGTLTGQYLGANNVKQARRAIVACTFLAILFMGTLGLVMMFAGHGLTSVISNEPIHLELVPQLLFIAGITQVGFAVMMVIRQALKGAGDTFWTMIITSVSSWGIRIPAAWFLGVYLNMGLVGIWYALCGEMIVRAIMFYTRFKFGGWVRSI
ncbi:MAG: MATE family efflux transporter [Phycisphaerales bacterium]|nr:MATE family efflux transporter [Phycisphaerales bacterium]